MELITVTLFESLDAVRAFAGRDCQRANVSAPTRDILPDIDELVRHYTVVVAPGDTIVH